MKRHITACSLLCFAFSLTFCAPAFMNLATRLTIRLTVQYVVVDSTAARLRHNQIKLRIYTSICKSILDDFSPASPLRFTILDFVLLYTLDRGPFGNSVDCGEEDDEAHPKLVS